VQRQRPAVLGRPHDAQRAGVFKEKSRLLAPARTMSQPATAAAIKGIVWWLVR
jgi:hypothetical protein